MKKISIIITVLLIGQLTQAQVAIGKNTVSNNSVSIEFDDTTARGLILPFVTDKDGITENGTIIYDTTDHKVKYLKNGNWFDWSVDETGVADLSIQNGRTEEPTARVAIGEDAATNTTDGILVLTDDNRAMVLPSYDSPYTAIKNPAPGMMVYDKERKMLCVYNGSVWTFWKP